MKTETQKLVEQLIQLYGERRLILHWSIILNGYDLRRRFGWLKNRDKLILLHELLTTSGFINEHDVQDFTYHFDGRGVWLIPIVWMGDRKELVYLFQLLIDNGFIRNWRNKHKLLDLHFLDENGERFKAGAHKRALSKIKGRKTRVNDLINIVHKLD